MDWEPIVSHLARAQPALVVDGVRRVRFLNEPMEQLLGYNADELTERGWLATCVPQRDRSSVRQLVTDALNGGGAREGELPIVTREGRQVTIRAGLSVEGKGRSRALVLVARDVGDSPRRSSPVCDCMCVVSRTPGREGDLLALQFLDPRQDPTAWLGQPLEALLTETKTSAVATSNALRDVIESRTPEMTLVLLPDSDDTFRVVTVRAVDDDTVHVTVRCLEASVLPDLVDARVARVAEANGLSDRERQVLQLLLRGRGVEDIATMLEIAPRTVKFHQANVLQKLGADSRLDLLRVVL
jgi:PAS domain S-box-containing protein